MKMKMKMKMVTPNPFSLFFLILLCLPLALIFTISSDPTTTITTTTTSTTITTTLISTSEPHTKTPSTNHSLPLVRAKPRKTLHTINVTPNTTDRNNNTTTTTTITNHSLPLGITTTPPHHYSPPPLPPPPPLPEDDPDDVDLLQRASRVDPNPTPGGQKKVAFMFLTTTPLPFAPLWELFFNQSGAHGLYNVYIHTDPRFVSDGNFTGVFSSRILQSSKPTRRNTPTLIMAARRLLAHALLDDPANYMFTLLSASCIPLHSFNFTYNTLVGSSRSFIEVLNNETTAYARWAARGEDAMLPEVGFDVFRIGSQFWSLTRQHARVVVEDVSIWRKFRLPCLTQSACYPEENYFPTLLSMVDPEGVVPTTLTHVNWWGQFDGHPHTYNVSEVGPDLIRWLRGSRPRYGNLGINGSDESVTQRWDPFLFARKFGPECLQPLMRLADEEMFKD